MPDQTCGDPKLPASGGAPDVGSATGILGVAHGGTGADLSNGAAAKVLATPPGASGPLALRTLDPAHIPTLTAGKLPVLSPSPAGSYTNMSAEVDQYGRVISASSGAGSGGNYFSPTEMYLTSSGDFIGDYTCGSRYLTDAETTVLGVRFRRWTYAATIQGEVWIGGISVASKSLAVDPNLGPTLFEVLFDSPLVIPKFTEFFVTSYDGGSRYAQTDRLSWDAGFQAGLTMRYSSTILLLHPGWYRSGHNVPASYSDAHSYPTEPIV